MMTLIRRIRSGQAAIVRDRHDRDHLVCEVKVVLRRMANYWVRMLTGILDANGCHIQIVLERVRSILDHLRDLVRVIIPPMFGFRIKYKEEFEVSLVWGR